MPLNPYLRAYASVRIRTPPYASVRLLVTHSLSLDYLYALRFTFRLAFTVYIYYFTVYIERNTLYVKHEYRA